MGKVEWVPCSHCGEDIRSDAKACRHCGSDENTGWSEDTYLDGIDLPEAGQYEDNLDAEGFTKREKTKGRIVVGAVALLLVALFAAWLIRQIHF